MKIIANKNVPSLTQNTSNFNLQEAKDTNKSKMYNQRSDFVISKKSKIKVYKCKFKVPSMDDAPPISKMSTYVFGKKDMVFDSYSFIQQIYLQRLTISR